MKMDRQNRPRKREKTPFQLVRETVIIWFVIIKQKQWVGPFFAHLFLYLIFLFVINHNTKPSGVEIYYKKGNK